MFHLTTVRKTTSDNVKKKLKRTEDPKRRLLGPNIWLMTKMGLLLPENKFAKVANIIFHFTATVFVMSEYMEIYVIRSDLNQVIENVKIPLFSITCVIKLNAFLLAQKEWKQVLDYITESDEYE